MRKERFCRWMLLAALAIMGVSSLLADRSIVFSSAKVWVRSADGRVGYEGRGGM